MLRKTALTLGLVGALAAPAIADTITFKNGHEVHGRLVEETDKHVIFQVGNGKMKFDKKEIATFTEDADYGQRYFSVPKRQTEPDNVTPGSNGKPGRSFVVPDDATPEERKDLKGVHARIEEELAKLGASNEERVRKLDLPSNDRATLDAALANLGKGKSTGDIGNFGVKAIPPLADALQAGDTAARGDAAAAIDDAVRRGDETEVKWALGRYKIATLLATVLDSSGDEKAAKARDNANRALETISSTSNGWTETKEGAPTDSQRAATAKWKAWAATHDSDWEKADKEREGKRRQLNTDWRELDDSKSWRKALARCIDTYGTTTASAGKKDGEDATAKPKDADDKTNPDIAKAATPEELKALAEAKSKIKKLLDETVGLSVEDKKKKYAPSSDELQDMKQALHNLGDRQRRGGAMQRKNAINNIVTKYGIKAIAPLSEALNGDNIVEDRGVASAVAGIVGANKDDAPTLIRAYGMPARLLGLLDYTDDKRAAGVRYEGNKALEAISGTSMGWPALVEGENASQSITPEESEAKTRWNDWVAKDSAEFDRTEKAREDHRKTLNELLKKLDSPRNWKEALEAAPGAISKAERDLAKK